MPLIFSSIFFASWTTYSPNVFELL